MTQEPIRPDGESPENEEDFEKSNMLAILFVAGGGLVLLMMGFAYFWYTAIAVIVAVVGYLVYLKVR